MNIIEYRIYSEVYEQGIDIQKYLEKSNVNVNVKIISTVQSKFKKDANRDSIISKYMNLKKFDALISILVNEKNEIKEYPITIVEYSTALPTDDHILQRFDGIYWASILKIPYIRISPKKINNTNHGGGSKLTLGHELYVSYSMKAIYNHFEWSTIENSDYIDVNKERISCPPELENLKSYFFELINCIQIEKSYSSFYENFFNKYYTKHEPSFDKNSNLISSTRLNFSDDKKYLRLKFNRFGHAMDPERGMLSFFYASLNGNVGIEFQIQREIDSERGSYSSLFDDTSNKEILLEFIHEKNNKLVLNDYLYIFKTATCTENLFKNIKLSQNIARINDDDLKYFLLNSNNQTIKTLLLFAKDIILTDLNRNEIVKITWNNELVGDTISNNTLSFNNKPLDLQILKNSLITEDIVTYIVQYLFRKSNLNIIAVSYPGAQGDRCILSKSGRKTKRTYIDVIAIENNNSIILNEAKKSLKNCANDVKKLMEFISKNSNVEQLIKLVEKISQIQLNSNNNIYSGISGNGNKIDYTSLDYYIAINIDDNSEYLIWTIYLSNIELYSTFKNLATNDKLQGKINIHKNLEIYFVK